jgi:prevent-host-death family protein
LVTKPVGERLVSLSKALNVAVFLHITALQAATVSQGAAVTPTTLTSREFNRDTSGAKKAAAQGPVFITERGRPVHVLLTIEDYLRLTGERVSLADALGQSEADFEFNPPRIICIARPAGLG